MNPTDTDDQRLGLLESAAPGTGSARPRKLRFVSRRARHSCGVRHWKHFAVAPQETPFIGISSVHSPVAVCCCIANRPGRDSFVGAAAFASQARPIHSQLVPLQAHGPVAFRATPSCARALLWRSCNLKGQHRSRAPTFGHHLDEVIESSSGCARISSIMGDSAWPLRTRNSENLCSPTFRRLSIIWEYRFAAVLLFKI